MGYKAQKKEESKTDRGGLPQKRKRNIFFSEKDRKKIK